jgi:transcriptional regulator with XRE-family HTH domain
MNFGEMIRIRRKNKKIGLDDLASWLGISQKYLFLIETKKEVPSETIIKHIAYFLDFDADYLLSKAGKVSSDIIDIILDDPVKMAKMIRERKND